MTTPYTMDRFGLPKETIGTIAEGWALAEKRAKAQFDQIEAMEEQFANDRRLLNDFIQAAMMGTWLTILHDPTDEAPVPMTILKLDHPFDFQGAEPYVKEAWGDLDDNEVFQWGMLRVLSVPIYKPYKDEAIHIRMNNAMLVNFEAVKFAHGKLEEQRKLHHAYGVKGQMTQQIAYAMKTLAALTKDD